MLTNTRTILLSEGRREDAYERYITSLNGGPLKDRMNDSFLTFIEGDPSGNHKYLDWMLKQMLKMLIEGGPDHPRYHENGVVSVVKKFHQVQKRLDKKDINQYKNILELVKALENLGDSKKERKLKGADKIYEDKNILVVKPKTNEGSCYYGASTKWCVAAKGDNQFNNYTRDGILYYLIWKPIMPEGMEEYQKIARYIAHGYPYETEGEYFTATDRNIAGNSLEYDLFGARNVYDKNWGVNSLEIDRKARNYYDSWDKAKINIDTDYAKHGMILRRTRSINHFDDFDDDLNFDF